MFSLITIIWLLFLLWCSALVRLCCLQFWSVLSNILNVFNRLQYILSSSFLRFHYGGDAFQTAALIQMWFWF